MERKFKIQIENLFFKSHTVKKVAFNILRDVIQIEIPLFICIIKNAKNNVDYEP